MLAICTDIDHTSIINFRETHRFLNTHENTSMGRGIGLDIANSMWLYKKAGDAAVAQNINSQISYFCGTDWLQKSHIADELVAYATAGWIDTLHSYGDFSQASAKRGGFTREHAVEAIRTLEEHNLVLPVWVNHGNNNNVQNIGPVDYMAGDDESSPAFHIDLLMKYGVRFVAHEHTHAYGNSRPLTECRFRGNRKLWGFPRFAYFKERRSIPESLQGTSRRDQIYIHANSSSDRDSFERLSQRFGVPYSGKFGQGHLWVWHPRALHLQITEALLEQAAEREDYVVLAQHLGSGGPMNRFGEQAVNALRLLAREQDRGNVLVSRTSRLLEYARVAEHLTFSIKQQDDRCLIHIESIDDPILGSERPCIEQLRGITFYAEHPEQTVLLCNGEPIDEQLIVRNPTDGNERSIGIRWHDSDVTDYTAPFRNRPDAVILKPRRPEEQWRTGVAKSLPEDAAARYADRLENAMQRIHDIGFAERTGLKVLTFASGGAVWPMALALQNAPNASIDCVEPSMADRNLTSSVVDALNLNNTVRIHDNLADLLADGNAHYKYAVIDDAMQQADHEIVLRGLENAVKLKGHVYIQYPGVGTYLNRLFDSLQNRNQDKTQEVICDLYSAELHRCGVGRTPTSFRLLPHDDLLALARMTGFRFIESPGFLQFPSSWCGQEAAFDVILERNANDKKKYFMKNVIDAHVTAKKKDAAWFDSLHRLIDLSAPRTVLKILDRVEWNTETDAAGTTRALATIKIGGASTLTRPSNPRSSVERLAHALTLYHNQQYTEATDALRQIDEENQTVPFMIGASHLASGEKADAIRHFQDELRKRRRLRELIGLLYALQSAEEFDAIRDEVAAHFDVSFDPRSDYTSRSAEVTAPFDSDRPASSAVETNGAPSSVDHVISVVGISFCGSSVLNLVLGSHPAIHGGGELHKLFIPTKHPRCSVCQYDCSRWSEEALKSVRREGLYEYMAHLFGKRIIVDSSKTINHFEATHPVNPNVDFSYLLMIKHPIRHLASYVNNKFFVNNKLIRAVNSGKIHAAHSAEILDYVERRCDRLLRDYRDTCARLDALCGSRGWTTLRYEAFVESPGEVLSPILEHIGLSFEPSMLEYTQHEHHPIGGNRGPHYQINKRLSTSRFVDFRKDFYEQHSGLTMDDKYRSTFSEEQLDAIRAMPAFRHLCEYLGYEADFEGSCVPQVRDRSRMFGGVLRSLRRLLPSNPRSYRKT